MATLMHTQKAILMHAADKATLGDIIREKGVYLRYLAGAVMSGSLTVEVAAQLLVNY